MPKPKATIEVVLVGWLSANHDPNYSRTIEGEEKNFQGPTLNLLELFHREPELPSFTHYFLFHQEREEHRCQAKKLLDLIEQKKAKGDLFAKLRAKSHEINLQGDPTKHSSILQNVRAKLSELLGESDDAASEVSAEAKVYFYVTPGTPAMHAVWISLLMAQPFRQVIEGIQTTPLHGGGSKYVFLGDAIASLQDLAPTKGGLRKRAKKDEEYTLPSGKSYRPPVEVSRWVQSLSEFPAHFNILLTGETGTGKGLLAEYLHASGRRRDKAMVAFNCGTVPETLIDTELFGIDKNIATDVVNRPGLFEMADGGTLFLDEIGDAPLSTQLRLLRALEGKVRRLGGEKEVQVDVQVIAATNRDLEMARQEKLFREDLLQRLNEEQYHLQPLREKPELIESLALLFLEECQSAWSGENCEFNEWLSGLVLAEDTLDELKAYHWPGNIRQLHSQVQRAVREARRQGHKEITATCFRWEGASPSRSQVRSVGYLERIRGLYHHSPETQPAICAAILTLFHLSESPKDKHSESQSFSESFSELSMDFLQEVSEKHRRWMGLVLNDAQPNIQAVMSAGDWSFDPEHIPEPTVDVFQCFDDLKNAYVTSEYPVLKELADALPKKGRQSIIAALLGVHRNTVGARFREHGLG